ncbi:MAG: T9SS type A sorting domain-containing protein [Flavobacteriales bacterium]
MMPHVRAATALLTVWPMGLFAQVFAGDPTGLMHTAVGIILAPTFGPPPMNNSDTASIDLEGDGMPDLHFDSGIIHAFDADGSYNSLNLIHEGVEVAIDAPGGYVAKRLNDLDPVDATLTWRAYSDVGINSLAMASLLTNFAGQWDTTGAGDWFVDNMSATAGYLGVRVVEGNDTLYGWVNLISYVSQDSSWLQIDDFAIETGTTGITHGASTNGIHAMLTHEGSLRVQGDDGDPLRITLRDVSGRIIHQGTTPSPCTLDIASEARGIYVLSVAQGTRSCTIKLLR